MISRRSRNAAILLFALTSPVRVLAAADLQARLNATYRSAWAVLLVETTSACDSGYTNNKVLGTRVLAAAANALPAGELGRIAKVDVKRSRVDVLIDIEEPLLVSWTDGPFTLYDQRRCRVELEIELPREWVKKKWVNEIEALLSTVLERHDDRESVDRSERWNRREVEPVPAGYDETFIEYQRWRAERLKAELASSLDDALREAQRAIDGVDDDPAYGAGLAAGMEKEASRYRSWNDCNGLAEESFYPAGKDAPNGFDGAGEREWEQGYRDGQTVAFNVELARRIGQCLREL